MNIYNIAEKAGVSIATVSRVLNSSSHVSEKTRQRVLAVMEKEKYVPNAFARGLGLDTMRMIGVMCTDVSDMFYASAVSCIEKLLRQQNRDIVLCCTGNSLEAKKRSLSYLVSRRVDAVVLIGSAFKEEKDNSHIRQAARSVPVFIINGAVDIPNVFSVVCDEKKAVKDNVKSLYQSGKRNILYLYDVLTYSGTQKLEGYREGLKDCGIKENEELILRVEKDAGKTAQSVCELFGRGVLFDAIAACEDIIAAGALEALRSLKITVPVIGFNNSVIAECTSPKLTSVDNMVSSLCETTVRLLTDMEAGKEIPSKTVISAKLTERESYKI